MKAPIHHVGGGKNYMESSTGYSVEFINQPEHGVKMKTGMTMSLLEFAQENECDLKITFIPRNCSAREAQP